MAKEMITGAEALMRALKERKRENHFRLSWRIYSAGFRCPL